MALKAAADASLVTLADRAAPKAPRNSSTLNLGLVWSLHACCADSPVVHNMARDATWRTWDHPDASWRELFGFGCAPLRLESMSLMGATLLAAPMSLMGTTLPAAPICCASWRELVP